MRIASEEAKRQDLPSIATGYILLGLLRTGDCVASKILRDYGFDLSMLRLALERKITGDPQRGYAWTPLYVLIMDRVVDYASEEARILGQECVGTDHLLLGLLRENDGVASVVLTQLGLELDDVRVKALRVRNHAKVEERPGSIYTGVRSLQPSRRAGARRVGYIQFCYLLGKLTGQLVRLLARWGRGTFGKRRLAGWQL
jgi:ATP-dependent Clp protease ATP-binding subunit ClpC